MVEGIREVQVPSSEKLKGKPETEEEDDDDDDVDSKGAVQSNCSNKEELETSGSVAPVEEDLNEEPPFVIS